MQNSSLGSLVKEITFWCPDYDEKIVSLIYNLAETCPNVQISKGNLHVRHWGALGGAVGSYWKQLKQLPEPQWSMSSDLNVFTNYYTLASVCHNTLTHVTLPPIPPTRSQFNIVFPLLPFFINLTHLIVNSDYSSSTLMVYDEVIQQCPNLMCFTLDSNLNIIYGDYGDTKQRELHQDTFDYVIHKFPNLGCCNVHLSVDDILNRIGPWITSHYEEKLRKFLEHLSSRRCDWLFTYVN
ncbi:hypothetical protein BCV72DRAFT_309318 [Rhizopus microsporus var. microsporus]|uniref:Uncharacterized protein n=1 Tax=Rhizopus microsporus var. microsporus TaxID=86635 RepID=A0A1X0QR54_RHIZD|nr:hypothetical protein BCV72DRAFT_309318 [Rhizopus microsporus var. microsporus]